MCYVCLLSEFSEFQGRGECVVFVSFQSSANSRAGVNVLCLFPFRVQRIPGHRRQLHGDDHHTRQGS